MFCRKCGAENDDSARFCHTCGLVLIPRQQVSPPPVEPVTPVVPVEPEIPTAPVPSKPKRSRKKLWILLTAAVLVIALGVSAFLLFRNSPKKVANDTLDAIFTADAETIFQLLPEDALKTMYSTRAERREAQNNLQVRLEDILDSMDAMYASWRIDYRVVDVETMQDEDLETIQEQYDDQFDCSVTAAKEVTVKLTGHCDDDRQVATFTLLIVKVDGKWCLDVTNLAFFHPYF